MFPPAVYAECLGQLHLNCSELCRQKLPLKWLKAKCADIRNYRNAMALRNTRTKQDSRVIDIIELEQNRFVTCLQLPAASVSFVLASAAFFLEPIGSEAKRLSDRTHCNSNLRKRHFQLQSVGNFGFHIVSIENKMSGKWFQ